MARPKASERQKLRAFEVWEPGMSPSTLHWKLGEEFGPEKVISLRTVNRWISEFRHKRKNLDIPFKWHELEDFGLPWEASVYLLGIWTTAIQVRARMGEAKLPAFPYPSVRQARWWWRLRNAVRGDKNSPLADLDYYLWAQHYVRRELFNTILGWELYLDDLNAYIAFKPWRGGDHLRSYLAAVDQHLVPRLREPSDDWADWGIGGRPEPLVNYMYYFGMNPFHPERLPTVEFNDFMDEIKQPLEEQKRRMITKVQEELRRNNVPIEEQATILADLEETKFLGHDGEI